MIKYAVYPPVVHLYWILLHRLSALISHYTEFFCRISSISEERNFLGEKVIGKFFRSNSQFPIRNWNISPYLRTHDAYLCIFIYELRVFEISQSEFFESRQRSFHFKWSEDRRFSGEKNLSLSLPRDKSSFDSVPLRKQMEMSRE